LAFRAEAGGEARHFAARDRDPLAGAGVHALAWATLGDVEFAEAGESWTSSPAARAPVIASRTASTASLALFAA